MARLQPLAPGLDVLTGATNVGVLRRNGRALLINSADPSALRRAGVLPADVDWVLVTHHHRSAAEGLADLVAAGARVAVPAAERSLFAEAESFWADDALYRVHCYNFHPSPRTLRRSVPVARALSHGEVIEWQGLRITALSTPGPSAGGMSYLLDLGGVSAAFTGDLLSGPGRLWSFADLQGTRPIPGGGQMMEYHGFGDRAEDVIGSLEAVLQAGATLLVPSYGVPMDRPREAVDQLRRNVAVCLANYYGASAARWYFAGVRPEWPADTAYLRPRLRPLPPWVREVGGTSRALVADDRHLFLMDCDGDIPDRLRGQQAQGVLGPVEGLWVTHYHDDHVGSINTLRSREGCPVLGHETMADILRRPNAYLMPCLNPDPIAVDRITRDGESWSWRGFRLTAYSFPGQSLFDAALFVERGDERVLFVGDSLGPGGLDDYCAQNRNLLGPGLGLDRCLAVVESLPPDTVLVNPHVEGAFAFTREDLRALRQALAERRELFARLIDWDDPNYGLDPQWVRCDPYHQTAQPGGTVTWEVHVRNYSPSSHAAAVALRAPADWRVSIGEAATRIPPGGARAVHLSALVPPSCPPGRTVVGFTLRYAGRPLLEMAEGLVDIVP
jgi:glyoxylase-like metal-dependent hydrolase (beta-lactamase superfamily II)